MQHFEISDEEKKLIIDDYTNAKLGIPALARKYHHSDYKVRSALQEAGVFMTAVKELDLMAVHMQTPCYKQDKWVSPQVYVKSVDRYFYDVTEAPMSNGFPMYGIDAPRTEKFPKWKSELQKRWNESGGEFGVNYAYKEKQEQL